MVKINYTPHIAFTNDTLKLKEKKVTYQSQAYESYQRAVKDIWKEGKMHTDHDYKYLMLDTSSQERPKVENALLYQERSETIKHQVEHHDANLKVQQNYLKLLQNNVVEKLQLTLQQEIINYDSSSLERQIADSKIQFEDIICAKHDNSNVFVFGGLNNQKPMSYNQDLTFGLNKTLEDRNTINIQGTKIRTEFLYASDPNIQNLVKILNNLSDGDYLKRLVADNHEIRSCVNSLENIFQNLELIVKRVNDEHMKINELQKKIVNLDNATNSLIINKANSIIESISKFSDNENNVMTSQEIKKRLRNLYQIPFNK